MTMLTKTEQNQHELLVLHALLVRQPQLKTAMRTVSEEIDSLTEQLEEKRALLLRLQSEHEKNRRDITTLKQHREG